MSKVEEGSRHSVNDRIVLLPHSQVIDLYHITGNAAGVLAGDNPEIRPERVKMSDGTYMVAMGYDGQHMVGLAQSLTTGTLTIEDHPLSGLPHEHGPECSEYKITEREAPPTADFRAIANPRHKRGMPLRTWEDVLSNPGQREPVPYSVTYALQTPDEPVRIDGIDFLPLLPLDETVYRLSGPNVAGEQIGAAGPRVVFKHPAFH